MRKNVLPVGGKRQQYMSRQQKLPSQNILLRDQEVYLTDFEHIRIA
jgi:hypothetical protein